MNGSKSTIDTIVSGLNASKIPDETGNKSWIESFHVNVVNSLFFLFVLFFIIRLGCNSYLLSSHKIGMLRFPRETTSSYNTGYVTVGLLIFMSTKSQPVVFKLRCIAVMNF